MDEDASDAALSDDDILDATQVKQLSVAAIYEKGISSKFSCNNVNPEWLNTAEGQRVYEYIRSRSDSQGIFICDTI